MLKSCLPCLIVLLFIGDLSAQAKGDWPQFLGPNRNGISAEKDLLDSWPQDGPNEVWREAVGAGMSGLAISGDRLVTMVQADGRQYVICLNADNGKSIWKTPVAPEYRNGQGHGPRATPTISGNTVITFTGEGILAALNLADGKILWSHDAVKQHGGKIADYGMSCSPLVIGNHAIVTVGAPKATVVAYEIESGEVAWKAGAGDAAGYSSPALLELGGRQQISVFTGSSVLGLDPKSGGVLWRYPYQTDYECNIATPLAFEDQLFISAGENHGCALLKVAPSGNDFQVSEVWSSQGAKSVLRNEWQTSILIDGYLYGFDNVGSAGPVTHLAGVNAATGERAWQELRFGKGNLIAADGKLFISTMKGELVVVKASPEKYQEIGRKTVIGTTRQAPALSAGRLYLRDNQEIVCLDIRSE